MDKTIHFNCIAFKCCLLSYISIFSRGINANWWYS